MNERTRERTNESNNNNVQPNKFRIFSNSYGFIKYVYNGTRDNKDQYVHVSYTQCNQSISCIRSVNGIAEPHKKCIRVMYECKKQMSEPKRVRTSLEIKEA